MAQILINIPNFLYKQILKKHVSKATIARAFQNGVVLPKGYGRLIDADKLNDYFWDNRSRLFHSSDCRIAIDRAETIIEADKEGEDADSN